MHRLYRNWQIYEHDILLLGGTVSYIGPVHKQDYRSYIQDAIVTLHDAECLCRMERFRDGTSVIVGFIQKGRVCWGNLFPEANELLSAYDACKLKLPDERIARMAIRNILQAVTLVAQIVLLCFAGMCTYSVMKDAEQVFMLIKVFLSSLIALGIGRLYTFYRRL